ncbi:MAG: transposase [Tenacibaculum sp.]
MDLRYILGVLIVQIMENLTDEGVLLAVQENIYMQYFVGLP